LKQKSNLPTKQASPEQIYLVSKNKIFVYPISKSGSWYIEINNNGKISQFDKKVHQNDLNDAIAKTIIFFYNKLKEKQNGK